jgi:signal transduction histidine kinase
VIEGTIPDETLRWRHDAGAPGLPDAHGPAHPPRTFSSAPHRPRGRRRPTLAELFESGEARCVSIDRLWRITAASDTAATWLGASQEGLVGADLRERVPIPLSVFGAIEACLRRGGSRQVEAASVLHPGRWMEFAVRGAEDGATIVFADVADGRAPADPAPAQDVLRHLTDAVSAEMALLDERGVVVSVNAAWRDAANRARQASTGLGRSYIDVCRWLAPDLDTQVVETALRELRSGASQSFVHTYERSGTAGPCRRQVRIARLRVGVDVHIVAIHEDLTEVARAQAALRDTSEQLLSAQEDERHRIAIELHDSTNQHLVAVGLGLTNLRRLTSRGGRTDEILDDMTKSLQEAVKEIRVLSYLMKPPAVEREGLAAHARRFVNGFGARTGLQTHFRIQGDVDALDFEVKHTAFRVVQEALANVYKHAQAKTVAVSLCSRRGTLVVRIADNGKGIGGLTNGRLDDVPLGVGIVGMRSRMTQLGGELRIESGEGGTIVTGVLPRPPGRPAPPGRTGARA